MKLNNQKANTTNIILIVILVLLLIGGGVYFVATKKPSSHPVKPAPTQSTQPIQQIKQNQHPSVSDETANWKTYRNEKYGFEVKYPQAWEVYMKGSSASSGIKLEVPLRLIRKVSKNLTKNKDHVYVNISVENSGKRYNTLQEALQDWEKEEKKWPAWGYTEPVTTEINGITFYTYTYVHQVEGRIYVALVDGHRLIFKLTVDGYYDNWYPSLTSDFLPEFYQMLSTFRLIKKSNENENKISQNNVTNQPAYLIAAYSKDGKNYIDVDYVKWFHGNAAKEAKVEDGECVSVDKCVVYHGYIRNRNPLVRTFEVSPSSIIVVNSAIAIGVNKLDNTHLSNPTGKNLSITFSKLKNAISNMGAVANYTPPFKAPKAFVTINVKNNMVTKIYEPYQE